MQRIIHNVLGTNYEVLVGEKAEIGLDEAHMGICKMYAKKILVHTGADDCDERELKQRTVEIIAHEIFHAYLCECGLDLDEEVEERLADFYMKNWKKMSKSILDLLEESGFLDK